MQARTIDAAVAAVAVAAAVAAKSSSSLGRFGTAVLLKKSLYFCLFDMRQITVLVACLRSSLILGLVAVIPSKP